MNSILLEFFGCGESGTEKDNMRIWGVGRDEALVNSRTQKVLDSMLAYAA